MAFLDALRSGRVLVMDGATGTELQARGLPDGVGGDAWNLTFPGRVAAVHRAYIDAGADVLVANTFQAEGMAARAGVELAREAAGPGRRVLYSAGPLPAADRHAAAVARAMAAHDADGVLVETCVGPDDFVDQAVAHAEWFGGGGPPLLVSPTFRRDGRRIAGFGGESPAEWARLAERYRAAAVGVNCGRDVRPRDVVAVVRQYRDHTGLPLFARPNAGTPTKIDGRWVYPLTPGQLADAAAALLAAGAVMVGGCCGTTPAHIAAVRAVVDGWGK